MKWDQKKNIRSINPPSFGRGLSLIVDKADLLREWHGSIDQLGHCGYTFIARPCWLAMRTTVTRTVPARNLGYDLGGGV